jgi:hypothetical protein
MASLSPLLVVGDRDVSQRRPWVSQGVRDGASDLVGGKVMLGLIGAAGALCGAALQVGVGWPGVTLVT